MRFVVHSENPRSITRPSDRSVACELLNDDDLGNRKSDSCALSLSTTLGPDAAPMRLDYSLADRKPQTLACDFPLTVAVAYPRELPEQAGQLIDRYSSAFVCSAT